MKKQDKLELTEAQIDWLRECTKCDEEYSIYQQHPSEGYFSFDPKTGLVNIEGKFDCSHQDLEDFKGVRFGIVDGYFNCSGNKLKSLYGAPKKVIGRIEKDGSKTRVDLTFDCSFNQLTSLNGSPKKVGQNFYCNNNLLISLERGPKEVEHCYECSYNQLTSLEGSPKEVGGYFAYRGNPLTSLDGAPKAGWELDN